MILAIVIPTRHRPLVAAAAVRSALASHDARIVVVVSDNSSNPGDVEQLREFCGKLGDPRLQYIRPPQDLAMPTHWEWAVRQALGRTEVTHVGVHYDRKLWKPGALTLLADASERDPNDVITHPSDFPAMVGDRWLAWQFPASGFLYEISTRRMIDLAASGQISEMGQPFPLLSNCSVPRAVMEGIRSRFGIICDSTSPDAAFTFRFAAVGERYLHLDTALTVMHSFHLSNGQAYYRGDLTGTYGDFSRLWGGRPWLDAAPIPGLSLGNNVLFHEYEVVRRQVEGGRFPPVHRSGYLDELARGLAHIPDPAARDQMSALLRAKGWRPPGPVAVGSRSLLRRVVDRAARTLRPVRPIRTQHTECRSEAEAIDFLLSRMDTVEENRLLDIYAPRRLRTVR